MLFLVFIFSCFLCTQTAKILGVFPAPGYSQFILAEVLMTELAKKGHEVTVISPYQPKNPPGNYQTILTKEVIDATNGFDLFSLASANLFSNIELSYQLGIVITEHTMKNKEVQELLNSDKKFDVVIVEQFFNDAMKGFASHFSAPLVLLSSMGLTEWNKYCMGVPLLPSISAVTYTSYTNQMTFSQRVVNLVGSVYDYLYRTYVVNPVQEQFLKKFFPKLMDYQEVVHNASLMLMNSHFTTSENVLLPYNMVEIGGFHVVQNPLSKDIQDFLDAAKDGAILFSLGSNLRSADLNPETLNAIFTVLGKLKQKVLWKFEKDLPNKPKNIFISKWLNQRDILAHPNVVMFITHGGLLSTIETIYSGVPMVGIPVFADQRMNMARASRNKIAKVVPFPELTQERFDSAINEVLNDPKFRQNSRKMSSLIKDRPVKPLDLAIYWIEFVIRHKGIKFEAPSISMTWIQVYIFDILGISLFSLVSLVLVFKYCVSFLKKQCMCSQRIKTKRE